MQKINNDRKDMIDKTCATCPEGLKISSNNNAVNIPIFTNAQTRINFFFITQTIELIRLSDSDSLINDD